MAAAADHSRAWPRRRTASRACLAAASAAFAQEGCPLVADGNVWIGNEEGELFILAEGKELKELKTIEFPSPLLSSVVAANGAVYITTHTHLYCFKEGAKPAAGGGQ